MNVLHSPLTNFGLTGVTLQHMNGSMEIKCSAKLCRHPSYNHKAQLYLLGPGKLIFHSNPSLRVGME